MYIYIYINLYIEQVTRSGNMRIRAHLPGGTSNPGQSRSLSGGTTAPLPGYLSGPGRGVCLGVGLFGCRAAEPSHRVRAHRARMPVLDEGARGIGDEVHEDAGRIRGTQACAVAREDQTSSLRSTSSRPPVRWPCLLQPLAGTQPIPQYTIL